MFGITYGVVLFTKMFLVFMTVMFRTETVNDQSTVPKSIN